MWEELCQFAHSMNDSWLLVGDFNDIASVNKKKGGVPASIRKCNIFKDRIMHADCWT